MVFCSTRKENNHISPACLPFGIVRIVSAHKVMLVPFHRIARWKISVIKAVFQSWLLMAREMEKIWSSVFWKSNKDLTSLSELLESVLILSIFFWLFSYFRCPNTCKLSSLPPKIHCCNASSSISFTWIKGEEGSAMNCESWMKPLHY